MGERGTTDVAERIEKVSSVAQAWREPEHAPRAEAVRQTLDAPNRFTEEALAFAVNAAMHRLTSEALHAWMEVSSPAPARTVGVKPSEGAAPLAGLLSAMAVLLSGHRCLFCSPGASPALVPAFLEEVSQQRGALSFSEVDTEEALLEQAEAILRGAGDEDEEAFASRCEEAGMSPAQCYTFSAKYVVAVLDGDESEEEREGLAEDALLYEGYGTNSVRLLWAPSGTAPDPYLEAMAHFRAVFPAHADTPGALQMQQAFLDARDQPHAYGEGLEFLMSRGEAQAQEPGHLRWVEYDALEEVERWLQAHAAQVASVVARPGLDPSGQVPSSLLPAWAPGTAHRRLLNTPRARAVLDFLNRL